MASRALVLGYKIFYGTACRATQTRAAVQNAESPRHGLRLTTSTTPSASASWSSTARRAVPSRRSAEPTILYAVTGLYFYLGDREVAKAQ